MWCAVRARANTTHAPQGGQSAGPVTGAAISPYNAAASVNMAIWMSFEVWLANTLPKLTGGLGSVLFDRNISFPR
ncbi:hypothetical protein N7490_000069 [Penicillium lividum]|nr:hypothetical protein N7490_000069 [Penicillium lividum]